MLKRILVVVGMLLFLVGCLDEDTPNSGNENDSSNTDNNEIHASLSDIVGVWDATETVGQLIDEYYMVIKNNGEYILYDYLGDSYNQGENCYHRFLSEIIDLGNGNFKTYETFYEIEYHIRLSGNDAIFTTERRSMRYTRTTMMESDFMPLCSWTPPLPGPSP